MKPRKYPYSGVKKRDQKKNSEPLILARPIKIEEIKVKIKVDIDSLRCGSKLSLDISGSSKKTRVELFYPEIFISNFEATQIEMLFYKKLEELTADKFMAFKESEWKSFCSELISKFRVLEGIQ